MCACLTIIKSIDSRGKPIFIIIIISGRTVLPLSSSMSIRRCGALRPYREQTRAIASVASTSESSRAVQRAVKDAELATPSPREKTNRGKGASTRFPQPPLCYAFLCLKATAVYYWIVTSLFDCQNNAAVVIPRRRSCSSFCSSYQNVITHQRVLYIYMYVYVCLFCTFLPVPRAPFSLLRREKKRTESLCLLCKNRANSRKKRRCVTLCLFELRPQSECFLDPRSRPPCVGEGLAERRLL